MSALTWQPSWVTSETTRAIRSTSACSRRSNRSTRLASSSSLDSGCADHGEALAHIARAQLDEPLLLEVAERGDDSAPLLAERGRRLLGIEVGPRPARLAARHQPPKEVGPHGVERGVDVVERSGQRPEAVAGVERRPLAEEAVELEIGEDRLQHERPDVESSRELVVGDGELRADIVGEDDRRAGRRSPRGWECLRTRSSRASGCHPGRRRARRRAGSPSRPARPISCEYDSRPLGRFRW